MRQGEREQQTGYLELLRENPSFRNLWLGSVVSFLGDWFNFIALLTLVGGMTGSPLAVGLVFIAKMLPWAVVSPFAGVLVDRFNRRRLMIGADVLRAVVVLGFLFVDDPSLAWLVYVLATLQMVIGAVFQPAKSASIPNLVDARGLLTANALGAATWSVMLAVGAAVGGLATEVLGTDAIFVIDAFTYLLSAWFIGRTAIPQDTEADQESLVQTGLAKMRDGWHHLRTHPPIARIALAKAMWAFAGGGLVFMLTLLADYVSPGAQAAGIGFLFMARGIGTGVGPIVARTLFTDARRWPLVLGACVVFSGIGYGLIGAVPWAREAVPVSVILILVVAAHASSGANWVLSTVLLQERTADRYRGRVFATEWLLVMLADTCSILTASLLLEYGVLDLRAGFFVFAAAQVACGVLWMLIVAPREALAYERT